MIDTTFPTRHPTGSLATLRDRLGRVFDAVLEASPGMRCLREAERLSALPDSELARLGIARDDIVRHAFRRLLI
jgi:hypothetical protein